MSVYKRTYRAYTGSLTPAWSRFSVLARYGFADVWTSRITNVLFVSCVAPTVISLLFIYIANSETARLLIGASTMQFVAIDERFFLRIFQMQCWLALPLTAWIGPRLMAADLANSALPIILSRPITRAEYVAGKATVLVTFLSAVTWAPALLLFSFQARMAPQPWAGQKWFIAYGMFAGALLWIALLTLLAMALASWVKWRIVATGLIFASVFVPAGVGAVFNDVMRTRWGHLINVPYMMTLLWERMLHVRPRFGFGWGEVPTFSIMLALAAICLACAFALNARIRAREVVRG